MNFESCYISPPGQERHLERSGVLFLSRSLLYSLTDSIHSNVFLNLRGRSTMDRAVVSFDASVGDDRDDLSDVMFYLQSLDGI